MLGAVKDRLGVSVLTDVHSVEEAKVAATVVDVLQVPALLSRQTDLLVACGNTEAGEHQERPAPAPHDIQHAIKKWNQQETLKSWLLSGGTYFGYNNLVNDFRGYTSYEKFWISCNFLGCHPQCLRSSGGMITASGGEREFVFPLAKAAMAVGVDAILPEVHFDPSMALMRRRQIQSVLMICPLCLKL